MHFEDVKVGMCVEIVGTKARRAAGKSFPMCVGVISSISAVSRNYPVWVVSLDGGGLAFDAKELKSITAEEYALANLAW